MSFLNMIALYDGGLNIVIVLVATVIIFAVVLLIKLSVPKSETTKKSQSAKRQKTSQEKDEKFINDRKEKLNREIKTLPSSAKVLDISGNTVEPKTNKKQPTANEKSPKKSVQTKKQQVIHLKNPTKNDQSNKKQLKSFISNDEEGEWQMVTTKKQKQVKQDEANTSKSNKKTQNSPEKVNKLANNKKVDIVNEKVFISTQIVDGENTPDCNQIAAAERDLHQEIDALIFTTSLPIQKEISVSASYVTTDLPSNETADNTVTTNVAIDELRDNGWTDTKAQKKKRRKPLRE